MTIEQRFWDKVNIYTRGECWEWNAGRDTSNYGRFWLHGKQKIASRVGWELVYGTIPKGICVLHSCDNPPCCNPEHWFLGTQIENLKDMYSKERDGRWKHALPLDI